MRSTCSREDLIRHFTFLAMESGSSGSSGMIQRTNCTWMISIDLSSNIKTFIPNDVFFPQDGSYKDNQTLKAEFQISAFFMEKHNKILVFSIFLLIYLTGVLMNVTIFTVICTNPHLHSPMYLFLCNLSFVDIYFTATTVPNLLYMLLSGNKAVSFVRCITQLYFVNLAASTEDMLLVAMAYDRYVAICLPLHYHNILNKKMCTILFVLMWVAGICNSLILTIPASKMVFCRSHTIRQFFCDAKAMTAIACSGIDIFYACFYVDLLTVGIWLITCTLWSYANIFLVIMGIKSKAGRKKAYSTCSSHVTVFVLYCGSSVAEYLTPTSKNSNIPEQVLTAIYTVVTPMLNPLIYSLRNKELKRAINSLLGKQNVSN